MAAPGARIRVPVAVACRVLGFTKQAHYQWLKQPLSARKIADAQIIQVLGELHEDDPEGGCRVRDRFPHESVARGSSVGERAHAAWLGRRRGGA